MPHLADDFTHIPAALTSRPQWVLWRGEDRITTTGTIKLNKIPIDPRTLHNADTTDPTTWGMFADCLTALPGALATWQQASGRAYRGGGLGFTFSDSDPYCGIDFDGCVDGTGTIAPWAQTPVDQLASYTEITPSGTGLHVIVEGTLPPKGRKKGPIEAYSYARFFTMTGWHVAGTPATIEARQEALTAFHTAIFGQTARRQSPRRAVPGSLADAVLLDKARRARNGARFAALFAGDCSGYPSQSEADLGLCVRLAFWTPQATQIDQLFRQSGLMRDKWDAQRGALTYGQRTIAEALARQEDHYEPGQDGAGPFRPLATRLSSRLATTLRSMS